MTIFKMDDILQDGNFWVFCYTLKHLYSIYIFYAANANSHEILMLQLIWSMLRCVCEKEKWWELSNLFTSMADNFQMLQNIIHFCHNLNILFLSPLWLFYANRIRSNLYIHIQAGNPSFRYYFNWTLKFHPDNAEQKKCYFRLLSNEFYEFCHYVRVLFDCIHHSTILYILCHCRHYKLTCSCSQ